MFEAFCAINQGRSKFEMRGLGLKEGTCSISLRVVYPSNHPPGSQVLQNATMWKKDDTTI